MQIVWLERFQFQLTMGVYKWMGHKRIRGWCLVAPQSLLLTMRCSASHMVTKHPRLIGKSLPTMPGVRLMDSPAYPLDQTLGRDWHYNVIHSRATILNSGIIWITSSQLNIGPTLVCWLVLGQYWPSDSPMPHVIRLTMLELWSNYPPHGIIFFVENG